MTLTLDVGNTTIALVGFDSDTNVIFSEKIPSDLNFYEPLKKVLCGTTVSCALISSVVPTLTEPLSKAVSELCGIVPRVINAKMYSHILSFAISEPEKLGLDRIADSAWVALNYQLPAITVDLGTATTFNVISKDSVFLGGIIAAGILTSLNSLCEHTAQLPKIDLDFPENIIGKNTRECMLSGAVFGAAAMVEGIVKRIEEELGEQTSCILTGGGAALVKPFLPSRFIYEPFLAARGIFLSGKML